MNREFRAIRIQVGTKYENRKILKVNFSIIFLKRGNDFFTCANKNFNSRCMCIEQKEGSV